MSAMAQLIDAQAVRLAQNLSLHKEDTYVDVEERDHWQARRRFVVWVCESGHCFPIPLVQAFPNGQIVTKPIDSTYRRGPS